MRTFQVTKWMQEKLRITRAEHISIQNYGRTLWTIGKGENGGYALSKHYNDQEGKTGWRPYHKVFFTEKEALHDLGLFLEYTEQSENEKPVRGRGLINQILACDAGFVMGV